MILGTVRVVLQAVGGLLVILAMLAAGGSVISLGERLQYGRGLLFMGVELFALVAVGLGGLGVFLLWLSSRLSHKRFSPPPSG
jgi:hypothetical protein